MPFDGTHWPVTETLIEGRHRVEAGWCQGAARTRDGVCIIGSLHDAPNHETYIAASQRLLAAVKQTGFARGGLPEFNDYPGRTQEEILAVFDDAIGV